MLKLIKDAMEKPAAAKRDIMNFRLLANGRSENETDEIVIAKDEDAHDASDDSY